MRVDFPATFCNVSAVTSLLELILCVYDVKSI